MKSIVIIVPYFGKFPEWFDLFIESCKYNPTIDWIIFTDNEEPQNKCKNVSYVHMSFPDFCSLISKKLNISFLPSCPYKICDLRLSFGVIFDIYIHDYDYFGWCDIDVIWGDIRKFVTEDVLNHDLIIFCKQHITGHLSLLKNIDRMRYIYKKIKDWKKIFENPSHLRANEQPRAFFRKVDTYIVKSYNTPLSPHLPWISGKFIFPTEWYWKEGVLTNNLDKGVEFIYLHFMHWKGGPWPRRCQNAHWEKLKQIVHVGYESSKCGIIINENGIFSAQDKKGRVREKSYSLFWNLKTHKFSYKKDTVFSLPIKCFGYFHREIYKLYKRIAV